LKLVGKGVLDQFSGRFINSHHGAAASFPDVRATDALGTACRSPVTIFMVDAGWTAADRGAGAYRSNPATTSMRCRADQDVGWACLVDTVAMVREGYHTRAKGAHTREPTSRTTVTASAEANK